MLEKFDKEYLKSVGLKIAGTVLGIAAIVYIGYQIWHKMTVSIKYEPATPYTYTMKSTGEGYIFRKETVIPSGGEGSVVPTVEEGTKVSAGSTVANMYSATGVDVEQKLADIDAQIALLNRSSGDGQLTNRDVSKIDSETYNIITDIRRCVEQNKFSEASSHKMNFITSVNRRNAASGSSANVASQIEELKRRRSEITSQLGSMIGDVRTERAGWYYPETDGYEGSFTVERIEKMTYEDYRSIINSSPADTSRDAGKIVLDPNWYFVCELDKSSLDTKEEGEEYTVYFPHNRGIKLQMTLEKICMNGAVGLAVFKTDKMPEGFDYSRMQSFELLENEYTGFKIPKSAVRVVDGYMGVYVLTGEVVHFRMIDVVTEYEDNYIVAMDHEKEEETVESAPEGAETGEVAQSPEWSKEDAATERVTETESAPPETVYKWLGLNENVIISGKGLSEGKIITNVK